MSGCDRFRVLTVEDGAEIWGAQAYLLRLAPLLAARGVDQVLASPPRTPLSEAWRGLGLVHVPHHAPPARSVRDERGRLCASGLARESGRTARGALRIARVAQETAADAIAGNSHWAHLEVAVAARLTRRPALLHLHEESRCDVLGRMRGLTVRLAGHAVAVSQAVADTLPAAAQRQSVVIRNGIDTHALRPGPPPRGLRAKLAADPSAPIVLVACRLDVEKGVQDVLEAVALLPPHLAHVQVAIAGAPALDPGHDDVLKRLGERLLGPRVRFLGRREDVPDLLRACDAYVLASRLEGLPLGILEAQAVGCPVIAYATSGVPEILRDEVTGMLVHSGHPRELSACVSRLLLDPAGARALAQRARAQVVAELTLERQADALAALVRSVVTTARMA